jgi:hypothetical protein
VAIRPDPDGVRIAKLVAALSYVDGSMLAAHDKWEITTNLARRDLRQA